MNGILLINKPEDFTSFDVIAKLKGILRFRKIGHGGTLDPMATGVLPIFLGRAAKAVDILPSEQKRYIAKFQTGIKTDTLDITGTITERAEPCLDKQKVLDVISQFIGDISQTPPMYSAIRVNGARLYDLARAGSVVERPKRDVTIESIDLIEADTQKGEYTIDVLCSKGTYIRTLCDDIGEMLGSYATITSLQRTMSSGYKLEDCITLDDVQRLMDNGEIDSVIKPVDTAFMQCDELVLDDKKAKLFLNGVKMRASQFNTSHINTENVRVYSKNREFLGLASLDKKADKLRIIKLFVLIAQLEQ